MGDIELELFSKRIKEVRIKLGLTQKEFAEKIGVTAAALSAYEKNLKNPSIMVAKKIANVYELSLDWLVGLSDKESSEISYNTYTDVIYQLIEISLKTNLVIQVVLDIDDTGYLTFYDKGILQFIGEWEKMKLLFDNGTIDSEVYDLWIEKTLTRYNVPIGSLDYSDSW